MINQCCRLLADGDSIKVSVQIGYLSLRHKEGQCFFTSVRPTWRGGEPLIYAAVLSTQLPRPPEPLNFYKVTLKGHKFFIITNSFQGVAPKNDARDEKLLEFKVGRTILIFLK